LPHSKELADGILTLSEMMRYALGEAYTGDGKVLLHDEIEHLRNFIKMNQFRFRSNLNIHLEVKGDPSGAVIIPFVLITLTENIFKHGDLSDPMDPVIVRIDIREDNLSYYGRNKKKTGPKELSTGIGLDNVRKRLQLTYGSAFSMNVKEDQQWYETDLKIEKL
jgi:LytS/YehU family sensor histidine kinase